MKNCLSNSRYGCGFAILATLVLAAFPQLLALTARLLGVQVPSNLLFAMTILLALGVCLHLSWEISVVEDETRTLAEEAAILRTHIERLEARLDAELAAPSPTSTAAEPAPLDRG